MKTEQGRSRRFFLAGLGAILLASLALARHRLSYLVYRYRRQFTRIPLDQSPYLRDVAEPITVIKGEFHAGSDDHWMGLTFKDSRQVVRYAEFVYYIPGTYQTLRLGGRPVSAREECVFLGLLQRWARQHPEPPGLRGRARQLDPATGLSTLDRGEIPDEQVGQLVAGSMIGILLKRN